MTWSEYIGGGAFLDNWKKLPATDRLDCGVAVAGHSFDVFNEAAEVVGFAGKNALIYFLFRFLEKLQGMGTVPAIDWSAYAENLGGKK